MTDDTFCFIIHPITIKKDVSRKYPILGKILTEGQINFFSQFFPPVYISEIHGVVSQDNGKEATGWFIACPFTPPTMMRLPVEKVYRKIVACGHMAEELGAKVLGLGAYTSVVGDAGAEIAKRLDIPVTNGDSYTVYIAVEAVREAARVMDILLEQSRAAVVGATGTIGSTCAEILAGDVAELILIGRREEALKDVYERCRGKKAKVRYSTDIEAIYNSDLILTVTSATHAIIEPEHIKPGAVVCDVARPRDVSWRVHQQRDDVLVIEGGMVEVPGPVDFGFDFGFPPGKAFACMAETMALALEGRYEDYSVGKYISIDQALEIGDICARHGFKLSGFRSFEKAVTPEQIDRVREKAQHNRRTWTPYREQAILVP
ncbi:MAG: shikimate 5-dehydrogenase [Chloroflexota bacterium]|nr:shikimate dehydrogenase [Chloroflexota bacterium]NOG63177.1 shikimate dehydrogenase [Chloroflexota bacterium]GIK62989.1 MAG: shikimate 5-dehydrogenase [Chloroflexota bacterium]